MDPDTRPPHPTVPGAAICRAAKGLFPTDSDTHLLDRLNAIYKYRYVVVTVFFWFCSASRSARSRRRRCTARRRACSSRTSARHRSPGSTRRRAQNTFQDPEPYYQTQLRILTGRELAARSWRELQSRVGGRIQRPGSAADGPGFRARHDEATGAERRRTGHGRRASAAPIGARHQGRRRTRQQFPRRRQLSIPCAAAGSTTSRSSRPIPRSRQEPPTRSSKST